MTTEAELEAKRARAEMLRRELRSLRTEGNTVRVANEREATNKALDDEIDRLERELATTVTSAGGTVEDAEKVMAQAAKLQDMMTPEKDKKNEESNKEDARPTLAAVVERADANRKDGDK